MNVKLFCFPYAGGSASLFVKWKNKLPEHIEVVPVELSGRGGRIDEPLYKSFDQLIEDIYPIVKKGIGQCDAYALLGFSMGGLIAYEIYRQLRKEEMPIPDHLFIIGREAPNTDIFKVNHLNDHDFIEEVYSYDGMPQQLYENKEILKFFLPILRADFGIHETYEFRGEIEKMLCNLTVWYGMDDKSIIHKNVYKWKDYAMAACKFIELEGGHFIIKQHQSTILNTISNCLSNQFSIQS
jgi:surfactin synthase thioesterase subunit